MATLTIEITDGLKTYIERQVASGAFKDSSAVVQALFDVAVLAERRDEIDQKLLEAEDEFERGECAPWRPGDTHQLLRDLLHQRGLDAKT